MSTDLAALCRAAEQWLQICECDFDTPEHPLWEAHVEAEKLIRGLLDYVRAHQMAT